jgi:hypothetical protein
LLKLDIVKFLDALALITLYCGEMLMSKRIFHDNAVWIEIKPLHDTAEGWQEAVELVNNMLNRLCGEDEEGRKHFRYTPEGELHYLHGYGEYSTIEGDKGYWFNLDYFGRIDS